MADEDRRQERMERPRAPGDARVSGDEGWRPQDRGGERRESTFAREAPYGHGPVSAGRRVGEPTPWSEGRAGGAGGPEGHPAGPFFAPIGGIPWLYGLPHMGAGGGYGGSPKRGSMQRSGYGEYPAEHGRLHRERGMVDRATDEAASWFGDEGAERRREEDHRGKGPRGYRRSDERIAEDVNDHLTDDPSLDASEIEVTVSEAEVTLTGTVASKRAKRRAEDCADAVSGVAHVQNNLRVKGPPAHGVLP